MNNKSNNLTDSDKIFITVALWISMVALFVTALTLPMLPDEVTIFYKTTDMNAEYYSKYNNLLIVFVSVIPAVIIIAAALLRYFGKMKHNFQSITLFSIVLSCCMSGICIYGIMKQFDSTSSIRDVNTLSLIALCLSVLFSVGNAIAPTIVHSPAYRARATKRKLFTEFLFDSLARYWSIGASGFLLSGIVGSFIVGALSFIPVSVFLVAYVTFIIVMTVRHMKQGLESAFYDSIDV